VGQDDGRAWNRGIRLFGGEGGGGTMCWFGCAEGDEGCFGLMMRWYLWIIKHFDSDIMMRFANKEQLL